MGVLPVMPRTLAHSPEGTSMVLQILFWTYSSELCFHADSCCCQGHLFAVCGDGEYLIYTAEAACVALTLLFLATSLLMKNQTRQPLSCVHVEPRRRRGICNRLILKSIGVLLTLPLSQIAWGPDDAYAVWAGTLFIHSSQGERKIC